MLENQKSIEQPERDRGDDEQIHRCDVVGVVAKKGLPSLRWRSPWPHHVLPYGRLSDIDAQHEEFTVDPRCTPKRIRNTPSCSSGIEQATTFPSACKELRHKKDIQHQIKQ